MDFDIFSIAVHRFWMGMIDFGLVMKTFGWILGGFWMGFESLFDGLWMDV